MANYVVMEKTFIRICCTARMGVKVVAGTALMAFSLRIPERRSFLSRVPGVGLLQRLRLGRWGLAATLAMTLSGCSPPTTLEKIHQEKVLHVVTRIAPSVYYQERGREAGLEYELAQLFADELGVELRLEVVDNLGQIYERLDNGHTHFAAAGLPINGELESRYRTGPAHLHARPMVIHRAGSLRPQSPEDLENRSIMVIADSPHEYHLRKMQEALPNLTWEARSDIDSVDLLHRVNEGEVDIAIVDSNELAINKVYFPQVWEAFPLSSEAPISWLFPNSEDNSLLEKASQFFFRIQRDGTFAQLEERYYGHLDRLDYVGARTFVHHLENRLPRYQDTFMEAADAYELDWRLVAAIGYQESHWRPNAVSPTGVRGLMMLTQSTAAYMGVDNRLDPEASIWGGARYFRRLQHKIPARIPEPDRTWFALAAYNVGFGHLEDARVLTQQGGKDPDKWMHVKEFLPKLAQKKWYTQTRFGYARGWEPVIYVQNIRRYYDVLTWMHPDQESHTELADSPEPPLKNGADLLDPFPLLSGQRSPPPTGIHTLPAPL